MAPFRWLRRDLTDEQFRTAIFIGIASIPFTVGENWIVVSDGISAASLFVACVISGYTYSSQAEKGGRAGALTGFVGGAPMVVWQCRETLTEWWRHEVSITAVGDSVPMAAISVGAALLTGVILFALLLFVGMVGGIIGRWLKGRIDTARLYASEN